MIGKILLYLIIPLILSSIYFIVSWTSPIPSKTLTRNVSNPVLISRDNLGVPHISATSLEDAMYGLGYAMCEDRMWQIDMMRRLSTGRMSEFFGEKAFELDKFIRNMKIWRSAQDDVDSLPAEDRRIGQRFVDGVNDAAALKSQGYEYFLTGQNWENFTLVESQSNIYFVSLFLSNIWGADALKVQLKKLLGEEIEFLLPGDPDLIKPKSFCVKNEELDEKIQGPREKLKVSDFSEYLEFYTQIFDLGTGSNSWVISGKHTKSGKPILCNDPHLTPTVPSLWYLNHIKIKDYSQFGAAIAGFPMTSIGRNNLFSWGTTSLKVDDIDIYAEKVVNSSHYSFGDSLLPFKEFEEVIKVKGQDPVRITFRETLHGPMLENSIVGIKKTSPAFGLEQAKDLSIAWASLYSKDQSFGFISKLVKSKSLEELREAHSKTTAIRLSIVFSSVYGDIGYLAIGRVPIKSYRGDQVLPGWKPETKWKGFIPFEEMPFSLNPKKGFIVTANNFIAGDKYKYFESLGSYFSLARADRITEILQEKISSGHKFSAEDQLEILQDELDVFARQFVPVLLKNLKKHPEFTNIIKEIKQWDFVMRRESLAAGVYMRWVIEIITGLMKGKVKDELLHAFLRNQVMTNNFYNFFQDYYKDISRFCDNVATSARESCSELITESLRKAVLFVDGRTWGEMHEITLKHIPFSEDKNINWIFERKEALGGNSNTIHATYINWNSSFEVVQGPGLKMVADMGNPSDFFLAAESGMSENRFSRHYSDMFRGFHYGEIPRFEFD